MTDRRSDVARHLPLLLAAVLLSCADGTQLASGGIGGTGFTQGPIEGFGSIFVGGVEWRTDGASFLVDGATGAEKDLAVGMVVSITGDLDPGGLTGIALTVEQDDDLEGPVSAVDPVDPTGVDTREITVLGTTVIVRRAGTTFEGDGGFSFDTIAVDDVVEIDGLASLDGDLVATHVEKDGELVLGTTEVDLEGRVASLVPGISFDLGSVRVDLGPGTDYEDLDVDDLANGLDVEVTGVLVAESTVEASEVSLRGERLMGDFEDVEIEGFVTDFTSVADFRVAGVPVDASGASFEDGGPGDLADGVRVEVEGAVVGGVLIAEEVEIEDDEEGALVGLVADFVDVSDFRVNGVPVDASGAEFEGGEAVDLADGVLVGLEGDFEGGVLVAEKVDFRSSVDDDDDDADAGDD